jgi:hypothetical protein
MGILECLTLIFVVLKLLGIIDWSWLVVCLPAIVSFTFYLGILIWDIWERISFNKYVRKWRK